MKKRWVILNSMLFVLFAGVLTSQSAHQAVPTDADKSERLRQQFAVSLLRMINTAEVVEHTTYGTYSSWQTLRAHYSENFDQYIALHRQEIPTNFGDLPEILPGWNLRMSIHADVQGYDVLLLDMTDKKCGYAAITDENAIIRQGKAIDCEL